MNWREIKWKERRAMEDKHTEFCRFVGVELDSFVSFLLIHSLVLCCCCCLLRLLPNWFGRKEQQAFIRKIDVHVHYAENKFRWKRSLGRCQRAAAIERPTRKLQTKRQCKFKSHFYQLEQHISHALCIYGRPIRVIASSFSLSSHLLSLKLRFAPSFLDVCLLQLPIFFHYTRSSSSCLLPRWMIQLESTSLALHARSTWKWTHQSCVVRLFADFCIA